MAIAAEVAEWARRLGARIGAIEQRLGTAATLRQGIVTAADVATSTVTATIDGGPVAGIQILEGVPLPVVGTSGWAVRPIAGGWLWIGAPGSSTHSAYTEATLPNAWPWGITASRWATFSPTAGTATAMTTKAGDQYVYQVAVVRDSTPDGAEDLYWRQGYDTVWGGWQLARVNIVANDLISFPADALSVIAGVSPVSAASNAAWRGHEMPDGATTCVGFIAQPPGHWTDFGIDVWWIANDANAGNVAFRSRDRSTASGEAINAAIGGTTVAATPASASILNCTRILATRGMDAGPTRVVQVAADRLGADALDTYTGIIRIVALTAARTG